MRRKLTFAPVTYPPCGSGLIAQPGHLKTLGKVEKNNGLRRISQLSPYKTFYRLSDAAELRNSLSVTAQVLENLRLALKSIPINTVLVEVKSGQIWSNPVSQPNSETLKNPTSIRQGLAAPSPAPALATPSRSPNVNGARGDLSFSSLSAANQEGLRGRQGLAAEGLLDWAKVEYAPANTGAISLAALHAVGVESLINSTHPWSRGDKTRLSFHLIHSDREVPNGTGKRAVISTGGCPSAASHLKDFASAAATRRFSNLARGERYVRNV